MKTSLSIAIAIAGLFVVASSLAMARGQRMPLPPVFSGGSTGNWLGENGNGPIFGFDDPLGDDFFGGGGNGSNSGWRWEPIGSGGTGGNGGSDGNDYPCPGNCWDPYPVGPCTPMCDCYASAHWPDKGTCWRVDKQAGRASECKNNGTPNCSPD